MSQYLEEAALLIAEQGWALVPGILPEEAIAALCAEARDLYAQERFRPAGVGRGEAQAVRAEIRRDQIYWLTEEERTPAQARYREAMEELRLALNRSLFLSLIGFEAHYAAYTPGGFYKRHVDRHQSADERVISSTLYLNPDWEEHDGGQLRLYADEANPLTILPRAGTFVLFRSDTVPHEVLPAIRLRFSLTGWFRRRSLQPF